MGIENTTFVRDARSARRAAAGAAALAWPPEAAAFADAITTFWLRQMTPHTLNSMTVPSSAPVRMVMAHGVDHAAEPSGARPIRSPMMAAPVRNVTSADHR